MGNMLTFYLQMKDMLSSGLAKVAQAGKGAFAELDNSVRKFEATIDSAANHTRSKLGGAIDYVKQKMKGLSASGGAGGGGMGFIGGTMLALAAGSIGKKAIGLAADREQQRISFQVMTGSKEAGNKMLEDIVKMGAKTPYESGDLIKNAQTLKGFGIENKKILPILNMIGDVGAGSAEKMQSLTLAFAQVSSAGKLTGQDLLQMVNAGFNPLQEMVKAKVYPSMAVARKAMERGAIGANMVEAAFKQATGPGGQFFQMMQKQSETTAGKWSTFTDNLKEKIMAFGEKLLPVANWVMQFANGLMQGEGPAIAFATVLGGITLALTWNAVATGVASGAMSIFNAVMNANPIVLIITLLAFLGIWLYNTAKKYEGFGESVKAVWGIVKAFGANAWWGFKIFAETSWYYVEKLWLQIKNFAETTTALFTNIGKALNAALTGDFDGAKVILTDTIITKAGNEIVELEKRHQQNQAEYAKEAAKNMADIANNWNKIGLKEIKGQHKQTSVSPSTYHGGSAFAGLKSSGGSAGSDSKEGKGSVAKGITGGGPRVININGLTMKLAEKMEIHAANGKDFLDQIEGHMSDFLLRVLNSGASVQ